jgi:hypothetical protein
MKKIILLIFFLPVFVFAKTNNDSIANIKISDIEQRLSSAEKSNYDSKIEYLDKRLQDNENLTEKSFNSISTQLSVMEIFIGVAGVFLALLVLLLGWYINHKYEQVVKLKSDNEDLLDKATVAKEEVEKTNRDINDNISEVYKKIKREETVGLLDRLVDVPQDISNICALLLSRKLEYDDFNKLKKAYLKLLSLRDSSSWLSDYKILFFQHFFVHSIKDPEITTEIIEFISDSLDAAFENDIEKTTKEFAVLLSNENISLYNDVIVEYFKGLSKSKFKDYKKVYEVFFDTLNSRNKQFELFDIVLSNQETEIAKIEYGLLLKNKYSQAELSEEESESFDVLETTKEEYKKKTIAIKESEIKAQEDIISTVKKQLSVANVKSEIVETERKKQTDAEVKIKELQDAIEKLKEL